MSEPAPLRHECDAIASPRTIVLSPAEAERAIYIDFEGTGVDPPSLLGVLRADGEGPRFVQYVIEPVLWPAAEATAGVGGGICRPAEWADLVEVRRIAMVEDRRIVAWSNHERDELFARVPGEGHQRWFCEHVVNAIPMAKRWRRENRPDANFKRDPRRGTNQLHCYLDLINYSVRRGSGPGHAGSAIRDVRRQLQNRGDYTALTPTAKGKWTRLLNHNWHDCDGLRELVRRCADDLS